MTIYRLKNNFKNFYSFTIKNAELGSKMPLYSPRFAAQPRLNEWVEPNGSFYRSSNYQSEKIHIPDVTIWNSGLLVLNQKAYISLSNDLNKVGEFLPVKVEGLHYYLLNTIEKIDEQYLDKSNAKEDPNIYGALINVSIDSKAFKNRIILKSSIDDYLYMLCSSEFVEKVKYYGLKGLLFEEISF